MLIHYVDGVCGSYKTTHALKYAVKAATQLNQPILFVQPTTKLITQSIKTLAETGGKIVVKRFDSVACPGSVFADLRAFMREWNPDDNGGCIVFITHACLWGMPWFPNKKQWNLIIDEIPDVDFEYHLNLPDTAEFALQSVLQAAECGLNAVLKLSARPEAQAKVEHWSRNPGNDDLIKVVQPLFRELTSQHSQVFITRASWQRLGWEGHGQVAVHGWRAPSVCDGWKSVRIMGAFFTDSLLYMIWSQMDVEFRPDKQIKVATGRHDERLGKRVSIHYFSEKAWSKKIRDKIARDDDPLALVKPILADLMGDCEFLVSKNNDVPDVVISKDFAKAIVIPAVCHGLNEYRHVDKIAFLSALNNTPGHFSYLDKVLAISPDQLRQARANQVAYQSIMRTALRDADSAAPVTVLVPDIALANWLTGVFPGCTLHAHETPAECREILGNAEKARVRPRKQAVLTPVERNARSAEKRRVMSITNDSIYKALFVISEVELSHEQSVHSLDIERSGHVNWEDVRIQLHQCHDQLRARKEENTLVSGALFDVGRSTETAKGLANIVAVNGVWLDFDGGALMPNEFARMFTDARWLMWNSFNNGKDGASKYRVLFPTKTPMTPEMYCSIWDAIADRIRGFGYHVGSNVTYDKALKMGRPMPPQSGLDVSKRTPCSFFYMPCRAGLGSKYTFWRECWDVTVPMLTPDLWVTYAPVTEQEYDVVAPHQNPASPTLQRARDRLVADADISRDGDAERTDREHARAAAKVAMCEAAKAVWRATPRGQGDDGFYKLGVKLRLAGLEDFEVRATLEQEVAYAPQRSQADRRTQIPSIMSSLRKLAPARRAA